MDGEIVADAWEEAAKQYKPNATPAPAAAPSSGGNDDWKLWQQTGTPEGGKDETPLGDQPATPSGVARTFVNQGIEGAKGVIKGLGRSAYNVGSMALNPFGVNPVANYIDSKTGISDKVNRITTPSNTAQTVGSYLPDAAMALAPLTEGANILPNVASAGRKLEAVQGVMKGLPVNIDAAAPSALRAEELRQASFARPPILKNVLGRLAPGAEPTTFRESSDLASNAGKLSTQESMRVKPQMQAQVNALAKALRESNQTAADSAGVGDLYKNGIDEYRRAMKIQGVKDTAGKIAKSTAGRVIAGAGLGAGGYAAYQAIGAK